MPILLAAMLDALIPELARLVGIAGFGGVVFVVSRLVAVAGERVGASVPPWLVGGLAIFLCVPFVQPFMAAGEALFGLADAASVTGEFQRAAVEAGIVVALLLVGAVVYVAVRHVDRQDARAARERREAGRPDAERPLP